MERHHALFVGEQVFDIRGNIERVAIIDHDTHTLYVEDIDLDELEGKYQGEEEKYIADMYNLKNFSWDFITAQCYTPADGETMDFTLER